MQDKGATQYDRKDHKNPEVHKSAEEAVREVLKTIVGKGFDEPLKQLDAIYQYVISVKLFDTERADKDLAQRLNILIENTKPIFILYLIGMF